ncbi:MAG: sugar phosphate isomerase/epimerase family protein, partial [Acidobacteriota bacterium]
ARTYFERMNRIGVMQGRLLPPVDNSIQAFPRDRWADEFPRARQVGFQCIEWVYDGFSCDFNPLVSAEGIQEIKRLESGFGVAVRSVCADYFMDYPLVRADQNELEARISHLEWLLQQCPLAGIECVVLPFVDRSAIKTKDEETSVLQSLLRVSSKAEKNGMEIHLETDSPPDRLAEFLHSLPEGIFWVNYDSGNSASLGYRPREEFEAYGARVGSIHIKDRVRQGETVPLGTGDADLEEVFGCLRASKYTGDLILQVARGEPGDEVNWARLNRDFVLRYLDGSSASR